MSQLEITVHVSTSCTSILMEDIRQNLPGFFRSRQIEKETAFQRTVMEQHTGTARRDPWSETSNASLSLCSFSSSFTPLFSVNTPDHYYLVRIKAFKKCSFLILMLSLLRDQSLLFWKYPTDKMQNETQKKETLTIWIIYHVVGNLNQSIQIHHDP